MAVQVVGEQELPVSQAIVWAALNDVETLRQCIPGCENLEKTEEGGFAAVVTLKIGPVKARFKGIVALTNINAPSSYSIVGEGKGGIAGFAKGSADVALSEEGGGITKLTYVANAEVGGKLAQLGSRLIHSTARKLSGEFFEKFSEVVSQR